MTELAAFLAAYVIAYHRRWLWSRWTGATNEGRVMFGVCVYLASLLWWWAGVVR